MSIGVTNDAQSRILFTEFIDGDMELWKNKTKGESIKSYEDDLESVKPQLDRLKQIYGWNDTVSFTRFSSQEWATGNSKS